MGEANPYGRGVDGTPESVRGLTLADLTGVHGSLLRPEHATLLVAGDITPEAAKALMERALGNWAPGTGSPGIGKSTWSVPTRSSMLLAIVDRPGAPQTMVMYAAPGSSLGDARRVPLDMVGTILGGSFTSRLNQNLRERNGFTYGVRADFAMQPSAGWFFARSAIRTDATGAALKEFAREFEKIRAGDISGEETTKAALTLRQDTVRSMGTLGGLLGQAQRLQAAHLPWSTLADDLASCAQAKPAALNALAKPALAIEQGVLVLVGDKAKIMPQLEGLGLAAPVFLDAWGSPVSQAR